MRVLDQNGSSFMRDQMRSLAFDQYHRIGNIPTPSLPGRCCPDLPCPGLRAIHFFKSFVRMLRSSRTDSAQIPLWTQYLNLHQRMW
jgi:hypothetical protein